MNEIIISNCKLCTFFIHYSKDLKVLFSQKLKISSYIKELLISNVEDSLFSLFINSQPKLTNNSIKILFSPYNIIYKTDPPIGLNFWDKPNIEEGCNYSLLEPSEFFPFVIPFGEEPEGLISPLPSSYSKALQWRERLLEERHQLILKFCKKAPAYANNIQEKISEVFKNNILNTEKGLQIQQLNEIIYY